MSSIELFKMSLLYPRDVDDVLERMHIIRNFLHLNHREFSRLCSCTLELARLGLLFSEDVPRLLIKMQVSGPKTMDVNVHFRTQGNIGTTPEIIDECQKRGSWLKHFGVNVEQETKFQSISLIIYINNLKTGRMLSLSILEDLKHQLEGIDSKSLARKSKEELIQDLLSRDRLLRKAMEVERLKSQFLANMSHELRTPLNAIIGLAELLEDEILGELNEEQRDAVKEILSSGNHLLQLINQILDLSKIEAGKMVLHETSVNLINLINDVLKQVEVLLKEKNITAITNVQVEDLLVLVDELRIKQVLLNLISNAIKFSPPDTNITITINQNTEWVIVSVKDEGIGISDEHKDIIFEEFRQVDDSHSRLYEGTGLGLALCKKLVELHGGKIWVESKLGQGSTFTFTIPRRKEVSHSTE